MRRLLFLCLIASLVACGNESILPDAGLSTKFQQNRHDALLDQKIQPLLNQYFAVMGYLHEQDTADLQLHGALLIQLADSLIQQELSVDSATQTNAVQGLMNIQSEMKAILMEASPDERLFGAQMLSLHWTNFLASIGYQQQKIYIFSDQSDNQWIQLSKNSTNPFSQNDKSIYQASQVLQELK